MTTTILLIFAIILLPILVIGHAYLKYETDLKTKLTEISKILKSAKF